MSLKAKVMRGSAYMVLREGLGMVINIGGVFLITRVIGPEQYGIFAAAFGLSLFLQNFGHMGLDVYLVRHDGTDQSDSSANDSSANESNPNESNPNATSDTAYHQVFTLMLIFSSLVTVGVLLANGWIERWVNLPGFGPVFAAFMALTLVVVLGKVPLAKLERQLEYKRIAMIELLGQILAFGVALPLAVKGFGAWAPTAGYCAQQLQSTILLYASTRYRPALCWEPKLVKSMMHYGLGVSSSHWVWYLQALVNPLLVGRFAGAAAVGYVAFAIRIADSLSFVKSATYRISIAALSHVQDQPAKLRSAITEGMSLQILALGPLLVLASWWGPILLPLFFGDKWAPAMQIYPFIALCYLANAMFNLHCSTLFVLRRVWDVTIFHAAYVASFFALAYVLIPRVGMVGYGWAEAIANIAYLVVHLYVVRAINSPNYTFAGILVIVFGLALFVFQIGWWAALGLIVVALLPQSRFKVQDYIKTIRGKTA
jgi:O-antigen/teichoic acid export membrane protein